MTVRQIVTGHNQSGESIFISDKTNQAVELQAIPDFKTYELWKTDGPRTLPVNPNQAQARDYFPKQDGSVFRMISFPPQKEGQTDIDAPEQAIDEISQTLPGLLEHMELDAPGMHTTDSVDYGIVLKGEIILELDNGIEKKLSVGDCVVQNGTRHAWHNRSNEPTLMAFILLGATRETNTV